MLRHVVAVGCLLLVACPGQKTAPPKEKCEKVGESCAYAPGKLGVCIEAASGGALVCQSQH